jgi:hypothetical protein
LLDLPLKANLAPPGAATWCRLATVDLENTAGADWDQGDKVGVIEPWTYPKPEAIKASAADIRRAQEAIAAGGPWRANQQRTSPGLAYQWRRRWVCLC